MFSQFWLAPSSRGPCRGTQEYNACGRFASHVKNSECGEQELFTMEPCPRGRHFLCIRQSTNHPLLWMKKLYLYYDCLPYKHCWTDSSGQNDSASDRKIHWNKKVKTLKLQFKIKSDLKSKVKTLKLQLSYRLIWGRIAFFLHWVSQSMNCMSSFYSELLCVSIKLHNSFHKDKIYFWFLIVCC